MAINAADYYLVDTETGMTLGADTTVVVPEVLGELAYDLIYEPDAAIEYAEAQGVELELPGAADLQVSALDDEPRGYLAIDTETGVLANASSLRLVADTDDGALLDEPADHIREVGLAGETPTVPAAVRDLEGLPFESVNA